jgi:Zn-dependent peptidase ImmA (M78 family)/DNA-binding XRE family transcriptional regulator
MRKGAAMAAFKALVKPELLVWTRKRAKVRTEDAAKAANVAVERLEAWERGEEAPTVSQLRLLAAKYHFPLAVFYLPAPPADFAPLRDFRRLPEAEDEAITPNLAFHIRGAYERRELALELYDDLRGQPETFPIKATVRDDPEKVGQAIRDFLNVDNDSQTKAARQDRAFDFWRRRMEERNILVFVISGPHYSVELKQMRGFAIAKPELPVIVVNGRDYSQGGKAFTLLHELAHIILGESAISNGSGEDLGATPEEQRIERFCDAVAAAALMPRGLVLSFADAAPAGEREWSDTELRTIARAIGVSREALLIRFVSLKRASWDFYHEQRERFQDEYRQAAEDKAKEVKKPVAIKRSIMLMSWNGRGFTRLVLRSYYDQRITLNDVSSYLGAKVKHIPALERAAFQMAE